ncbi:Cytochrome P450 4V2 [Araneus ventricosus]|uniref:Cytochrome P450 4V2 n=1 Tax=Araneus ventricosus TaxID=182803 RepID=A0A4Y2H7X8_ARAVE|nr:Cytochrome P450 4V2 [Araneus ventricosus]
MHSVTTTTTCVPNFMAVIFSGTETIEKAWFYNWLQVFFGTGLLNSGGNKWRSRRRFLNGCFRKDILKEHVPIINEKSRILVESLKKETSEDFTIISKPISECMTNTLNEILFGPHKAENQCELRDFIYALKWGMRFIAERIMNIFLWPDFIYFSTKRGRELKKHAKAVKDFTRSRIQQRKQKHLQRDFSAREAKGRPLLDLLLEYHLERTDFTENDLSDELITFMTAGQDSTTVAISWTLYMLGLYQDIQAKVHEELDLIFCEDPERHVTLEALNKMKYLKSVIKETLRLYPPAPFLARQVHEDVNICAITRKIAQKLRLQQTDDRYVALNARRPTERTNGELSRNLTVATGAVIYKQIVSRRVAEKGL